MVRTLAAPGWVASIALLLGIAVQPLSRLDRWHEGRAVVPALALLLVLSLVARARDGRLFDRLIAAGAVLALAALAIDALRGHAGTITLVAGQGTSTYEEEGPGGRTLGLRPLGTIVRLDRMAASGDAVLRIGGGAASTEVVLTADRSTAVAGLRLGDPRFVATGDAASLTLLVSGPSGNRQITLVPGETAHAGGADIALERYFADFALDASQQPFSRSPEPRNPASLLAVRADGRDFRVFVIQALPEIHRQEGLDLSFSLLSVEPERALRLRVTAAPAAPLLAAGLAVVALGLALSLRVT